MATINSGQDYDIIQTLTFNTSSGNCAIRLYLGGSAVSNTVYYRAGTSGTWTSLSVPSSATTFPISSTTMQVGHSWNKSGDDYMTSSFRGETKLTGIAISQKAALSGTIGNYFMYCYAYGCTSLTSLDIPDTSSVTTIGISFMSAYAQNCSSLTSLSIPSTSSVTSIGNDFMGSYANGCTALTTLSVPDTSNVTSVGTFFMEYYARNCTNLTSLGIPDTSNPSLTSIGDYFMYYYASNCSALTKLILPAVGWFSTHNVDWLVPAARLNYLKGYVIDSADLSDWQGLTVSGKTLYTNYIQSSSDVLVLPSTTKNHFLSLLGVGG